MTPRCVCLRFARRKNPPLESVCAGRVSTRFLLGRENLVGTCIFRRSNGIIFFCFLIATSGSHTHRRKVAAAAIPRGSLMIHILIRDEREREGVRPLVLELEKNVILHCNICERF